MSPLDSPGADVDIEDGTPVDAESVATKKEKKKESREGRLISNYQDIVNDLAGEGGATLRKMAALYANRIDAVIREDPECRAYQAIFEELKVAINIGKSLTNMKINEVEEAITKEP